MKIGQNKLCVYYDVVHETEYTYQWKVSLSQQLLHMAPRDFDYQETLYHYVSVEPGANESWGSHDYFGNPTKTFCISSDHEALKVRAESRLRLLPRPGPASLAESPPWERLRWSLRHPPRGQTGLPEECQFLYESPHVPCRPDLARYAAPSFTRNRPVLEAALDLAQRIFREFEFDGSATTIATPLDEVLRLRRGVCQDFAHLMVGCLRTIGIPCRYVSGYILTTPPPGKEKLVGSDASHAWVSVHCPGFGWVDFDPTNNCLVRDEHVTVGWGRDFSDVTPMRGVILGGGEQSLKVSVTVTRLLAEP